MAEGKTPGDAANSPFGDSKGATQATGASSGAHNFLEEPTSNTSDGGRDFTKENRPQEAGDPADRYNESSVPDGGDLPFEQTDDTADNDERGMQIGQIVDKPKAKPFKLSGE